jgi:hypothetical protein
LSPRRECTISGAKAIVSELSLITPAGRNSVNR